MSESTVTLTTEERTLLMRALARHADHTALSVLHFAGSGEPEESARAAELLDQQRALAVKLLEGT